MAKNEIPFGFKMVAWTVSDYNKVLSLDVMDSHNNTITVQNTHKSLHDVATRRGT